MYGGSEGCFEITAGLKNFLELDKQYTPYKDIEFVANAFAKEKPSENDFQTLLKNLKLPISDIGSEEIVKYKKMLREQIQADFIAKRVFSLDGHILAITEMRIFLLIIQCRNKM